jgi:Poxvirus Late Transcription Factor VLTF3 like
MSKKSQLKKTPQTKDNDILSEKDIQFYKATSSFCSPVIIVRNIKQPRLTNLPVKTCKKSDNKNIISDNKEKRENFVNVNFSTSIENKFIYSDIEILEKNQNSKLVFSKKIPANNSENKNIFSDNLENKSEFLNKCLDNEDFIDMKEYDIFHIDKIIRDKLKFHKTQLPQLKQELDFCLKNKTFQNENIIKKSSDIRKKIQDIEYSSEFALYIYKINDIVKKYRNLLGSDNSRSFVCLNKTISDKEFAQKTKLISQFISIAREYINIKNYYRKAEILICLICNKDTMKRTIDDEAVLVCSVCGYEIKLLDDTPSFKDTDRLNMGNRYTYSRRSHFYEAMKKYQGKHNIDPEILKNTVLILESQMKLNNLTKETVTKNQLYTFLSENKLSNNYDDINLLFHIITGKPCPDFSKLEGTLLELFEQQEKALDEIAGECDDGRINSINVYYKLYKLLQHLRYPCRKTDFCILKTKAKEDEHDAKMKKAWEILGWKWIDTF